MNEWYRISEEDALDTPGVVVYRDRIKTNIDTLIESLLYGVPFHVCPTIALHDQTTVVSDGRVVEHWHTARHRSIEQQ